MDIDEFGERTSQALVARTRGELDAVTPDLPAGSDAGPGTDDIYTKSTAVVSGRTTASTT